MSLPPVEVEPCEVAPLLQLALRLVPRRIRRLPAHDTRQLPRVGGFAYAKLMLQRQNLRCYHWYRAIREGVSWRSRRSRQAKPVVIKKYANRRLYNTQKSAYVTLEDLSAMVREGVDFVVR